MTSSMHFTEPSSTQINSIVKQEHGIDVCGFSTNCPAQSNHGMHADVSLADIVNDLFIKPILDSHNISSDHRSDAHINELPQSTSSLNENDAASCIASESNDRLATISTKHSLQTAKKISTNIELPEQNDAHLHSLADGNNVPEMSNKLKCPKCDKVMQSYTKLKLHKLVDCQFKPFKCKICSKNFVDESNLKAHQELHPQESKDPAFKCVFCSACFKQRGHMNNHIENSHLMEFNSSPNAEHTTEARIYVKGKKADLKTCSICNKNILKKRFTIHIKVHEMRGELKCPKCHIVMKSYTKWRIHEFVECKELHICKICRKKFKCKHILDRHRCRQPNERPYKCHICGDSFEQQTHLNVHFEHLHPGKRNTSSNCNLAAEKNSEIDEGEYDCSVCTQTITTSSEEREQEQTNQALYKCHNCDEEFQQQLALANHLRWHRVDYEVFSEMEKAAIETGNFKCAVCMKELQCEDDFLIHIEKHHIGYVSTEEEFILPRHEEIHLPSKCYFCACVFKSRIEFQKHQVADHYMKPLNCNKCGSSFTSKENYKTHMVQAHNGKAQLKCTKCSELFFCKYTLSRHKLWIHSKERPFSCKVCDKAFRTKGALRRHQWSHATEKQFKCSLCDAAFQHKSSLLIHEADHQVASDKPFQCTHCYKGFNTERVLKAHLNKHRERTFKCSICDKNFANLLTLQRHQRIHNLKKHQCPQCPMKFKDSFLLKRHVTKVHTKMGNYALE